MKIFRAFSMLLMGAIAMACAGCGGGGTPTYGSNSTTPLSFAIQTTTPTPNEQWGNVTVTGYADPNTLGSACDPSADSSCIGEVGTSSVNGPPFINYGAVTENAIGAMTTNGNGQAILKTDGQPAIWYFYASGTTNNYCTPQTTASSQTYQDEPTVAPVLLSCGSNLASMVASPAACTTTNNEIIHMVTTTCPTSVTLTFPSSSKVSLPTGTTLAAADYSTAGANLAQSSVSTSSPSTIGVPTPSQSGLTYLSIQNPSTGTIIGVAEFTHYYVTITPPMCGAHPCQT